MKKLSDFLYYEEKDPDLKIYCGDCSEILPLMGGVSLVVTDPPYGLGDRLIDGGGKLKNTPMAVLYRESDWEDIKPSESVFKEIFRASKNQIVFGGNYFNLPPTRCFLAWDKKQAMPTLSACEMAWTSFDKPAKIFYGSSTDLNRKHPTQKPVNLLIWCLENYSETEDTILDPFLGSGTTLVACKELNRNGIGIEINEKYCAIAKKRLQNTPKPLFREESKPQEEMSLF